MRPASQVKPGKVVSGRKGDELRLAKPHHGFWKAGARIPNATFGLSGIHVTDFDERLEKKDGVCIDVAPGPSFDLVVLVRVSKKLLVVLRDVTLPDAESAVCLRLGIGEARTDLAQRAVVFHNSVCVQNELLGDRVSKAPVGVVGVHEGGGRAHVDYRLFSKSDAIAFGAGVPKADPNHVEVKPVEIHVVVHERQRLGVLAHCLLGQLGFVCAVNEAVTHKVDKAWYQLLQRIACNRILASVGLLVLQKNTLGPVQVFRAKHRKRPCCQ
eukprot:7391768-Prymnesium_polylepis.4